MYTKKQVTTEEIREIFLKFFEEKNHLRISASSLIPQNDPTLLFVNSGMAPLKKYFVGEERPPHPDLCNVQPCIRTRDIEDVGDRHHFTFFEMLGSWSINNYFKEKAIELAYELLVDRFGFPAEKLYATVYQGNADLNLPPDEESTRAWERVGLPRDHIVYLGEDNFWGPAGDTGPCGPCTEVFFDTGDEYGEASRPGGFFDTAKRYIEIWNAGVFMELDKKGDGSFVKLPFHSVDTGSGLERMAFIINGYENVYETDVVKPIMDRVRELAASGRASLLSSKPQGIVEAHEVSFRVITDHARAAAFLIAHGAYPSNEWRGYVLRRIMRRAMCHGRLLGLLEPFLGQVTDAVVELMGSLYPELREHRHRVMETVRLEEERFTGILDAGVAKIREYLEQHTGSEDRVVDGKFLFSLYDTFGFPLDLAKEVFQEAGWQVTEVSLQVYEADMEAQRERARASAAFSGGTEVAAEIYRELITQLPSVDFLGYESLSAPARILAMVGRGRRVQEAVAGEEVEVIMDRTTCYAESGGQIGDTGTLLGRDGQGQILGTYFRGSGLIVHRLKVMGGGFREGEEVVVSVESPHRQGLRLHHTGTHLLHAALRKVLGSHVTQAGSLVARDRLRFDFTSPRQVKDRDLERIEDLINEKVRDDLHVDPFWTDLDQALKLGALALFDEKYGPRVRVVRIADFSVELCGGTHLDTTGQIGLFKIVGEGAVAAGVRRIEAVTGPAALVHVGQEESVLRQAADLLKIPALELPGRLAKLLEEHRLLSKQLADLEARLAQSRAQGILAGTRQMGNVSVVAARLDGLDVEGLRAVIDAVRDRLGSGIICLASVIDGKINLVTAVTKDLTSRFHAGKLVQEVARAVGGSGGGRPEMAQGGGRDPSKLEQALNLVYDWVGRTT